jgi:hypothetical protein
MLRNESSLTFSIPLSFAVLFRLFGRDLVDAKRLLIAKFDSIVDKDDVGLHRGVRVFCEKDGVRKDLAIGLRWVYTSEVTGFVVMHVCIWRLSDAKVIAILQESRQWRLDLLG